MKEEDALICDLAETYHIYRMEDYPVEYIATLLTGLRESSRVMLKITNRKLPLDQMINVMSFDVLNLILWSKTVDGQNNVNRPKRLMDVFNKTETVDEIKTFDSGEELLAELNRLARG